MEQRVSLITLAVADLARAVAFYRAMGWREVESPDGVVAFDLIGQTLGLYRRADLARDMGVPEEALGTGVPEEALGTGGVTLAYNVREAGEVAQVLGRAEGAGAKILRAAHDVFWGGHIGYFSDPDGHVWEVAHNPFSPLAEDGRFRWNGYGSA